jgi:hypothetical protein
MYWHFPQFTTIYCFAWHILSQKFSANASLFTAVHRSNPACRHRLFQAGRDDEHLPQGLIEELGQSSAGMLKLALDDWPSLLGHPIILVSAGTAPPAA